MSRENSKSKLVSMAESVRANILFDLKFELSPLDFFRHKMRIEKQKAKSLSMLIYQYNKNGN